MKNFDTMPSADILVPDWEKLKEEAPAQADKLMNSINLDNLSPTEQIAGLEGLLRELEMDNKNRFVYKQISLHLNMTMLEQKYQEKMNQLKEAVAE